MMKSDILFENYTDYLRNTLIIVPLFVILIGIIFINPSILIRGLFLELYCSLVLQLLLLRMFSKKRLYWIANNKILLKIATYIVPIMLVLIPGLFIQSYYDLTGTSLPIKVSFYSDNDILLILDLIYLDHQEAVFTEKPLYTLNIIECFVYCGISQISRNVIKSVSITIPEGSQSCR